MNTRNYTCAAAMVTLLVGCNSRQEMVGAVGEVTGGRVFRYAGLNPEQQQITELRSLNAMPGDVIRAGGFGRFSTSFLVEFGEKTYWKVETYNSSAEYSTLDAIVNAIAGVDEAAADVAQATLRLAAARENRNQATQYARQVAAAKDSAERADANLVVKDLVEREVEAADIRSTLAALPKPQAALEDAKSKVVRAVQAEAHAQSVLDASRISLIEANRALQQARDAHPNVWIFRASESLASRGSVTGGDVASISNSDTRSTSVLAVAAGLRNMRLVVGPNFRKDVFGHVDPKGKLDGGWFPEFQTTGPVTHVLQVQKIRYYTEGNRRATFEAAANFTPQMFADLDAADFMDLELGINLAVEAITSYENQGTFGDPIATSNDPYSDSSGSSNPIQDMKWMTIAATTTHLYYLRRRGRMN